MGTAVIFPEDMGSSSSPESPPMKMGGGKVIRYFKTVVDNQNGVYT